MCVSYKNILCHELTHLICAVPFFPLYSIVYKYEKKLKDEVGMAVPKSTQTRLITPGDREGEVTGQ